MMKSVKKYLCAVKDETDGAMEYAEQYIVNKNTHPEWAKMYNSMAEDELKHAEYLKRIGSDMINEIAYTPADDLKEWNECLAKAGETEAIVRLMLSK
jgi:hypothetical protein